MKNSQLTLLALLVVIGFLLAFRHAPAPERYTGLYARRLLGLKQALKEVKKELETSELSTPEAKAAVKKRLELARLQLKRSDFWLRYLEPIAYKKLNGPLPVEWETEVFEKFEAPYKRDGAGLTLAELYLEEELVQKDSLGLLVDLAAQALERYQMDSLTLHLQTKDHFFLCNRLFLLNLAAIYTTGFECPDTALILPELAAMLSAGNELNETFNNDFPDTPLPGNYLALFKQATAFVERQKLNYRAFDHFTFLREYVNPLFSLNQKLIREYGVVSKSNMDYALSKNTSSIFSKDLYAAQNIKGLFLRVYDKDVLAEIERLGKLLFYDPILSGNNLRSCASCHDPRQCFTDTSVRTAFNFNKDAPLPRNAPSLINAQYNHLLMLDGKHISLQNQLRDVVTNALEMNCGEKEVLEKVLSCKEYAAGFRKLLKYTPQEPELSIEHLASAITFYYGQFGRSYAPFDEAMNYRGELPPAARRGFNVFMGKAQCATCHFVPHFNGVKPPYVGSEFEVLGVPSDTLFAALSPDPGRAAVNPAVETQHAFRTGTLRNAASTKPYMHNGSFNSLRQVIDFYDAGGGAGRGLLVSNQTLGADSLHLSEDEKNDLLAFMHALSEKTATDEVPPRLPVSRHKALNTRKPGGIY